MINITTKEIKLQHLNNPAVLVSCSRLKKYDLCSGFLLVNKLLKVFICFTRGCALRRGVADTERSNVVHIFILAVQSSQALWLFSFSHVSNDGNDKTWCVSFDLPESESFIRKDLNKSGTKCSHIRGFYALKPFDEHLRS